jgi:CRP/FNR family transcriptional regulator
MLTEANLIDLKSMYPFLDTLNKSELETIQAYSVPKTLTAGEMVFLEGDTCGFFALILSGTIRIYKTGESGREITLYRFGAGESCILTASCILSSTRFPAAAAVEEDVQAVLIPKELLHEFVKNYEGWRTYFFDVLASRLSEVMETVEEVAFRKMDERILAYLRANSINGIVESTHQHIAADLGTSREVVSRILKDFEKHGLVKINRGKITILGNNTA